jgi:putative flippase GtrA
MVALIPAYNPEDCLLQIALDLLQSGFQAVVVVNDGSSPEHDATFAALKKLERVRVLQHAINLGKGAALKSGLNYIYCEFPESPGVVTLDADGQHLPEDAQRIGQAMQESPDSLLLGVRSFSGAVPLRSRLGNIVTRSLFQLLVGAKLADTQTGLRGIPRAFLPTLLKSRSNGYEFELDMLLACKYTQVPIRQLSIQTVYPEDNWTSHFNPLLDSMKIYFVLLRFVAIALLTAAIDYSVFYASSRSGHSILASQASARMVAMVFNYLAVKNLAFLSQRKHSEAFPRYALLVALSGTLSYLMITFLMSWGGLQVIGAKACAEGLIFLASFAIQRDFIFARRTRDAFTDWDQYYERPYKTAIFTRKITERLLVELIRKHAPGGLQGISIAELGGANSCFYQGIKQQVGPRQYHVFDNNALGLEKLKNAAGSDQGLHLHLQDVLSMTATEQHEVAFSVGLIEHFEKRGTKKAIEAHFQLLKPGGLAIISFPTPTLVYRLARWAAERTRTWIFHDERPLSRGEVVSTIDKLGEIVFEKINWPVIFTQRVIVARKQPSRPGPASALRDQPPA